MAVVYKKAIGIKSACLHGMIIFYASQMIRKGEMIFFATHIPYSY
jgi:hypothetical protein